MIGDTQQPFSVSVIVPVWNDAAALPKCLAAIRADSPDVEVIVVDGGSDDGSPNVARDAAVRVIPSSVRQRAAQMNLGAEHASGTWLLFLHADTLLPTGWSDALQHACDGRPALVGGCFRRRYDVPSRFLRVTCALANWRARRFGWFLGDQAIFVRAETFRQLGRFANLDACEDLDLSLRLARAGATCLAEATVTTSARRFHRRGPAVQTARDLLTAFRFIWSRYAVKGA